MRNCYLYIFTDLDSGEERCRRIESEELSPIELAMASLRTARRYGCAVAVTQTTETFEPTPAKPPETERRQGERRKTDH